MSYPRYYDGTTGLQGNGVGVLRDCISCTVTEERNGAFELEMVYPITGQHYSSIKLRGLIKAKPNPYSVEQLFRVYEISRPINGQVTVYAQHISYDLSGVPVSPCTGDRASTALASLAQAAAVDMPFTLWTDLNTAADFSVTEPSSLRRMLGGVEGSILDVYGGEYEWDNYTVKLHSHRGSDRGVTIRYGKNLVDLKQEESCAEVYTGVYPYVKNSDDTLLQLPEKVVYADGNYDYKRILTLDLSDKFDDEDNPATEAGLREAAKEYMSANSIGTPTVSLTVSFAQLEQTEEYKGMALLERVGLCDTVHVIFAKLGVTADAKCIKTAYNVLLGRYDSVELGDARSTLADTVANIGKDTQQSISKTKSALEQAITRATQLITGNLGGYVVLHSSTGSNQPDEILVMDTPDINTATRVWRWNLAGWGYSATGYNGPFRLAATMDGAINADFITAGTMTADLIRTGVLASLDGKTFYLNMESGELRANFKSLSLQGQDVSSTYTKNSDVRSRFAMDKTSVKISAGTVAFLSNTLTVDSDCFKINGNGLCVIKGTFATDNKSGYYASMGDGAVRVMTSQGAVRGLIQARPDSDSAYFEVYSGSENLGVRIYPESIEMSAGGVNVFQVNKSGDVFAKSFNKI
nr:MAG TPA: tail protein [Caudoviricetes sp.]